MAKKKASISQAKVGATAKAELVAKATYERKHISTEVIPPDVSRAKANAWLDLISPITEWAGLKGDQLRSKRALFRIQQEETLIRVGRAIQSHINDEEIEPVRPKILIPAIEQASLEDPSDHIMIERWAELLASASLSIAVQPRFVGILGELAGSQAETLEAVAFNNSGAYNYPAAGLEGAPFEFAEYAYARKTDRQVYDFLDDRSKIEGLINALASLKSAWRFSRAYFGSRSRHC
jgi:hypothetical protein